MTYVVPSEKFSVNASTFKGTIIQMFKHNAPGIIVVMITFGRIRSQPADGTLEYL